MNGSLLDPTVVVALATARDEKLVVVVQGRRFVILLLNGRTRGPDEIRAPRRRRLEGRRIVYQAEKLSVDGGQLLSELNRGTRTRVTRYNTVLILVNEDGHP